MDLKIGRALRRIREDRGLDQEEAAKMRGVSQNTISRAELRNVTISTIEAYLDGIGATPEEFISALAREHGSVYLGGAVPPSVVAEPAMQDLATKLSQSILEVLQEAQKAKRSP